MRRDGSVANPGDLRDFTLGFTRKASFDFIDVGHGKERADSKIKECIRWHLRNHTGRQIFLGISHDAGYAPFLDDVVTQGDRCRITIIKGTLTIRELAVTGLRMLNFDSIFRAERLIDHLVSSPAHPSTWAGVTSIAPLPPPVASPVPETAPSKYSHQFLPKPSQPGPRPPRASISISQSMPPYSTRSNHEPPPTKCAITTIYEARVLKGTSAVSSISTKLV